MSILQAIIVSYCTFGIWEVFFDRAVSTTKIVKYNRIHL